MTTYLRRAQRGFSLYELIVTLGVSSVLGVGAVSFHSLVRNHAATATLNEFVAEFNYARVQALKHRQTVVACPSADQRRCSRDADHAWWHRGMLVFVDSNGNGALDTGETVIRALDGFGERVEIKSSRYRPRVVFHANGMTTGSTVTFTFCTAQGAPARYVIVSNTGRARVSDKPADGRADEPLETCT